MTTFRARALKGFDVWREISSPFTQLELNEPAQWPVLPRLFLYLAVSLCVAGVLWSMFLGAAGEALLAEQSRETQLRSDFRRKLIQAADFEALKQQLEQVQRQVHQLDQQLSTREEMDALLADINQAAVSHRLQVELFRPGKVMFNTHHAEWPLTLRVTGVYHDIGLFASEIARLSRLVTLDGLSLTPLKDRPGVLVLEGTVKTYHHMDAHERSVQQQTREKLP